MVQYSKHQWSIQYVRKPLAHSTRSMEPLAQSTKALSRFKEKPLAQPPRAFSPAIESLQRIHRELLPNQ
jgi:hypothetical protein